MRKIIYSIEGNIGSGKSTLLKSLMTSMPQIAAIPEPVENWQHVGGYNLLDKYYEDPVRWGYTFQVNCVLSRMKQLSNTFESMRNDKVYVSERSVQADKFIFAKLMHKLRKMNDMEYSLYLEMFGAIEGLFNKHAFVGKGRNEQRDFQHLGSFLGYGSQNYFMKEQRAQERNGVNSPAPVQYRHIYLKTSAQKCFQRIKKRNRQEQTKMEYSYIKQLDNLHDEWLINGKDSSCLVLDGQREFQTDKDYLNELIGRIKSYIVENSRVEDIDGFMKGKGKEREKEEVGRMEARQGYVK